MDLSSGEHVLFEGHPSWRSILGFYLVGLIVVAAAAGIGFLVADAAGAAIAGVAAFVIVLLVGFLRRIGTTYTITNRRLHIKRGILARRTQEANLQRVQNVNTSQSVLQRVLQVGTVDFDTAGSGDYDFTFSGVSQPEKVVRAVDRAQHELQQELAAGEPHQQASPPPRHQPDL